jgi:hypothetical protein
VDPADHPVVRAGPVAGDQPDVVAVRPVQGGVVGRQHPVAPPGERADLGPQGGGVGFQPVEQAGERIVGRAAGRSGWTRAAAVAVHALGVASGNWM